MCAPRSKKALVAFAETEAWGNSIGSEDFYGWSGLEAATDAEYDVVRQLVERNRYRPSRASSNSNSQHQISGREIPCPMSLLTP